MKEQCMICGSEVEDVSGICPVCGAVLGRSTQVDPYAGGTGSMGNVYGQSGNPNMASGYGQAGNPNMASGYGQAGNPNMASGYGQPGTPNMNGGYGQTPYNYQQPGAFGGGKPVKKKLFSVLSIVMAALSVVTVCVPIVSILFAVASIVLGIIALVKKQVKVPAILGFVFSGIATLLAIGVLFMNIMMNMVCGTNFAGIMEQTMEILDDGIQSLENTSFYMYDAEGSYHYVLMPNGTYTLFFESQVGGKDYFVRGTYKNYGYADDSVRDLIGYEVLGAMREGYRMKNVTCLVFEPSESYDVDLDSDEILQMSGTVPSSSHIVFVVPDDYKQYNMVYQIEAGDEFDQELTPIILAPTTGIEGYMEDMLD